MIDKIVQAARNGIRDVWNAFMVAGAAFGAFDIPICPTTAVSEPDSLITWSEAKRIHKHETKRGNRDYRVHSFVCFYEDDYKFDGPLSGVWQRPKKVMRVLEHFDGVVTPDYSLCQDFPFPIKISNVYRMRAFGCWCGKCGLQVINNVRWGTSETWGYCFSGVPRGSVVAVGSCASGLKKLENRSLFEDGLFEMAKVLEPRTIIVYGSANYECFKKLEQAGIRIKAYPGATSLRFSKKARPGAPSKPGAPDEQA